MKHRELEFDGVGYVTGLGKSKYWGVAQMASLGIFQGWRISIGTGESRFNIAPKFKLAEKEAARIAASYYEYPFPKHPMERIVPSACGKFEYRINSQLQIMKFETEFGNSKNNPNYFPPKGNKGLSTVNVKSQTVSKVDWSIRSIKALREMTDMAFERDLDVEYWDMMIRIAEGAKKRLNNK